MDKENQPLLLSEFDFDLPHELIAQTPLLKRDTSRLLVLNRQDQSLIDDHFYNLKNYLKKGDILVRNNSKVLPARLFGYKQDTKAHVEILLLKQKENNCWECLVKGSKKVKKGTIIIFDEKLLQGSGETAFDEDQIKELEKEQLKSDVTPFNVGDTIRVYAKVVEGTRERLQMFEGVVIKRQNGGIRETFTVRRIASGVGVERTWPLHSPRIDRIEVVRRGIVRRAKLFYLRDKVGKAAKVKEVLR